MLIAIAQLRSDPDDPDANEQSILAAIDGARRADAALLVTSGAALTGHFDDGAARAVRAIETPADIAARLARLALAAGPLIAAIGVRARVGPATRRRRAPDDIPVLAVVGGGSAGAEHRPPRASTAHASAAQVVEVFGRRVALVDGASLRAGAPTASAVGVHAIAAVAAAPFAPQHDQERARALARSAAACGAALAWANAVGACGGRVFDGGSMVIGPTGQRLQQLPTWHPALALARIDAHARPVRGEVDRADGRDAYFALREAIGVAARQSRRAGACVEPPVDAAGALALMAAIDALGSGRVRQSSEPDASSLWVRVHFAEQPAGAFTLVTRGPERFDATIARPVGLAAARWRHALGRLVPDSLVPQAP